MSLVLYRKYRSQTFDELVGQQHVVSLIKNAVSQGQTSHAYLFHGPRGLGKTSTARILAKAVNCLQLQPDGNPCCECENCVSIQNNNFLDLIEIDAASNRGIDQIRELKERIEFSPSEGKYKVYIIDEVHMLTTEAFNALLKTLEEPPEHAIMILATTEVYKVPATILSRCQRFDFRLGSKEEIEQLLKTVLESENVNIEDEALNLIVNNARGSYRDALSLLDVVVSGQLESKDPKDVTEEEVRSALGLADSTMAYFFLEKLVESDGEQALDLIAELSQKGVNLGQFIKFVLSVLRDILLGEIKGNVDYDEYSFAKKIDKHSALKLINLFVEAEKDLKDTTIPTLPLEILIARATAIFEDQSDVSAVQKEEVPDTDSDEKKNSNKKKIASKKGKQEKKSTKRAERQKSELKTSSVSDNSKDNSQEEQSEVIEKPDVREDMSKSSKLSIELDKLKDNWGTILKKLGDYNSHLYAFMGRAKVLGLNEGVLKLAVAFDFHKDRLESVKSRDAVAKVFSDLFGSPVKISCEVDDSIRCRASVQQGASDEDSDGLKGAEEVVASGGDTIYNNVAEVFGNNLVDV